MKKLLCPINRARFLVTDETYCFLAVVAIMLIVALTGCATQSVSQRDENGLFTEYRSTAFFNKTVMTGTVLGKTTRGGTKQLFGQAGSSAETQEEAIRAMFEGMTGLFEAGVRAGAKSVVPVVP